VTDFKNKIGEYFQYEDQLVKLVGYCNEPTLTIEVVGNGPGGTLCAGESSEIVRKMEYLGPDVARGINIYREQIRKVNR
jgi:hypothetical protein